jgi:hypothetical protein
MLRYQWKKRCQNVSYASTYVIAIGNARFSDVLAEFMITVLVGVDELKDDEQLLWDEVLEGDVL